MTEKNNYHNTKVSLNSPFFIPTYIYIYIYINSTTGYKFILAQIVYLAA